MVTPPGWQLAINDFEHRPPPYCEHHLMNPTLFPTSSSSCCLPMGHESRLRSVRWGKASRSSLGAGRSPSRRLPCDRFRHCSIGSVKGGRRMPERRREGGREGGGREREGESSWPK